MYLTLFFSFFLSADVCRLLSQFFFFFSSCCRFQRPCFFFFTRVRACGSIGCEQDSSTCQFCRPLLCGYASDNARWPLFAAPLSALPDARATRVLSRRCSASRPLCGTASAPRPRPSAHRHKISFHPLAPFSTAPHADNKRPSRSRLTHGWRCWQTAFRSTKTAL